MGAITKYSVVYNALLREIQGGNLNPNERMRSEEEYAAQFGVSTITIRRALSTLVADGFIVRIKGKGSFVADQKSGHTPMQLVSMVVSAPKGQDISQMQVVKGAQQMLSRFGYSMTLEWNDDNPVSERAIIQRGLDNGMAGFLIYPFDPVQSQDNYLMLEKANIPYVVIDRYDRGHPTYFAGCDNYAGGMIGTQLLLGMKHRKIKFAAHNIFLSSEQDRYNGYCSAMAQAGLAVAEDGLLLDINYDAVAQNILARDTTAIFCCNDHLAMRLIHELTARGVRVPQDVSVLGFDNFLESYQSEVPLTSIHQDFEMSGQMAAQLLVSHLQGVVNSPNIKLLSTPYPVMRASVIPNPFADESNEKGEEDL